ncbi:hypothetical protein [Paenibacillus hexagrammi]|uniref:Uncharacterized protein n=1 Tax=Paenibacillus hexagrammi TaxID=2908839 RepID=A0ABY3SEH7_9BACL|nr:hypothetical protein [Paenibacillus sp. YPD9-1]UJF32207.1 hypothetical protein L0M14_21145 [Paenibacillus sp. YPD9-1]
MPGTGDRVQLYVPGCEEGGTVAVGSIHKSPPSSDPSVKYWRNQGKEVLFGGQALTMTAKRDTNSEGIYLKLDLEEGIHIQSDQGIFLHSDKDLIFEAEKSLTLHAEDAIYLLCEDSSIILDGNADVRADEIKMEGTLKVPVFVAPLPAELASIVPPVIEQESAILQRRREEAEKKKGGFWGKLLDGVQIALDVVGLIPGLGEVADLANAGISLARGDYVGAALSLAACIPFAGWAATGAKFARRGMEMYQAGRAVVKAATKAADAVRSVVKAGEAILGKVFTSARKAVEKLDVHQVIDKIKSSMNKAVLRAQESIAKLETRIDTVKQAVKNKLVSDANEIGKLVLKAGELSGNALKTAMNRLAMNLEPKLATSTGHHAFNEAVENTGEQAIKKTEVQLNYNKAMAEAEEEAAARAAKEKAVAEGTGEIPTKLKATKLSSEKIDLEWLPDKYTAVEVKGTVKVAGKEVDVSRRVYQIEIDKKYYPKDPSAAGMSNKELMEKGELLMLLRMVRRAE